MNFGYQSLISKLTQSIFLLIISDQEKTPGTNEDPSINLCRQGVLQVRNGYDSY